ncbi:MAG: Uncharacterized protein G01um101431_927 [Parcubacteria group bacterium Gr01-1014_31]|nr:MAG: Uncharacterized protein G01um101431_927 [Parcubacteria group bacterium Gr01-1014_31]
MRTCTIRLAGLGATALLLASALPVLAQTPTTTGPGGTRREERQERREEVRAKLAVVRQQNVRRHFNRMTERLQNRVERLKTLTDRIEARIRALDQQGTDTTEAKAYVAKAKTAWQEAKDGVAQAKTKLEKLVGSETPRTVFEELKTIIRGIVTDLKDAHANLVKAITQIRGLRVGNPSGGNGASTSTATTTP